MKTVGIIRDMDKLGRIVIPIELRNTFGIESGDHIEILAEQDRIILKKHDPSCIFCSETENISEFSGKPVCKKCLNLLRSEQ